MQDKTWQLAHGKNLTLGRTAVIMGILNVTPDSFSDGGENLNKTTALGHAQIMLTAGASIVDVGGESTRPLAESISQEVEQMRISPVIKDLARTNALVSVDTYNAATARWAINNGAHIINDVKGLQGDPALAKVAAETEAGIIIMHNSRNRLRKDDVIEDQKYFFDNSLKIAHDSGIKDDAIVLDPGFGFGKDQEENIALFRRAGELKTFGFPLLAGTSRKRFLGEIMKETNPARRDEATAVSSALLRQAGISLFRVHNVDLNRAALSVVDAIFYDH